MTNEQKEKLINALTDIAVRYNENISLKERIENTLKEYIGRDWEIDTPFSLEGLIEDVRLRDKKIEELKREFLYTNGPEGKIAIDKNEIHSFFEREGEGVNDTKIKCKIKVSDDDVYNSLEDFETIKSQL